MNLPAKPARALNTPVDQRRKLALNLVLAFSGAVLLALVLFLILVLSPDRNLVWLTPAEFASATRGGPIRQIVHKLKVLTAPLWQRFRRSPVQIKIDLNLITISAASAVQTSLGAPIATNADNVRVWILSRADLTAFDLRIKTNAGISAVTRPSITTLSGMQSQMFVGGSRSGLRIDLTPKVISGSIRLVVNLTSSEEVPSFSGGPAIVRTNLAAACRVLLSNGGGLVMEGPRADDPAGMDYWYIVSPKAVDPAGNLIKL